MPISLPEIKQLLADWYSLTLENPLYAVFLVLSAWLLTVFFYSIKLYFLNKKKNATEQAGIKLQGQLAETQQQNQQSEEKLTAITEQQVQEQQLATEYAHKVETRNQQIIENIKQLASKFDLSEQLVASEGKPEPEFVWQQQDNIQMQLTERLQAERQAKSLLEEGHKQEKEQFSSQKTLVEQLQKTLDLQIGQFAKVEQELDAQKLIQQQQKEDAEQTLAKELTDIQAQHELHIASLVNDLKQHSEPLLANTEEKKTAEVEISNEPVQQDLNAVVSLVQTEPLEPEIVVQKEALIVKTEAEVIEPIAEIVTEPEVIEPVAEIAEPVAIEALAEAEAEPEPEPPAQNLVEEQTEYEPDYTKSSLGLGGKFKGLFAKGKKQTEALGTEVTTPVPENLEAKQGHAESSMNIGGKFKGLFAKGKKRTGKSRGEQQAEVLVAEVAATASEKQETKPSHDKSSLGIGGKFKGLFAKGKTRSGKSQLKKKAGALAAQVPEKLEVQAGYVDPAQEIGGKFKGLFEEDEKQTDSPQPPVQQAELLAAKVIVPEPEQPKTKPNYSESNLDVGGKLKGLFAKGEKQADKVQSEKQPDITEPELQTEKLVTETLLEPDKQEYEPDYAQSNINLVGKVRKLFGKG